jgi:ABC-type antimicrobial peptide transport system permease subunit
VLLTRAAAAGLGLGPLPVQVYLDIDGSVPDAIEYVRTAAATAGVTGSVSVRQGRVEARSFANVRRGLYLGATVTLLLIGVSMLVNVLDQLRERRRLLAMLAVVGTRRGTLGWSVVWQTVLPTAVGLVLAVGFGLGLGAALLRVVDAGIVVHWSAVGVSIALAVGAVLLATLLSLPALARLVRPEHLRTE